MKERSFKPPNDVPKPLVDPAALLVNELADAMHLHQQKPEANNRPTELSRKPTLKVAANTAVTETNGIGFKAQLKKVEPKRIGKEPVKDEQPQIIDFKSRLRRVDDTTTSSGEETGKSKEVIKPETNNKMIKPNSNKIQEPDKTIKKTEIKVCILKTQKFY